MKALADRRVAVVHDWITGRRGGEKLLEAVLAELPGAEVFTLVARRGALPGVESRHRIHQSWIGALPFATRVFPAFLPFFHRAMAGARLDGYDLVVSVSHCVAAAVKPPAGTPHVSICLTPARYVWDLHEDYLRAFAGPWGAPVIGALVRPLRELWRRRDRRAVEGVTRFLAISCLVAERIARCYGRESHILHPPVEVAAFAEAGASVPRGERFLCVSALRPNKRVAELVEAFEGLGLPLDVCGPASPRVLARLRRRAPRWVALHGEVSEAELRARVASCRALVHPAIEDFGIAPVEAMAAGRPVIGCRNSGLRDSVIDDDTGRTGVLFEEPSVAGITAAVRRFLELEQSIDSESCRRRAEAFSTAVFRRRLRAELTAALTTEAE